MIIQNQNINLNSTRSLVNHLEVSEQLDIQSNNNRIRMSRNQVNSQMEFQQNQSRNDNQSPVQLNFSNEALYQQLLDSVQSTTSQTESTVQKTQKIADDESSLPLQLQLMKRLLEKLLGKKIKIYQPNTQANTNGPVAQQANQKPQENGGQVAQNQQWGMEYTYHEVQYQKESVTFSAAGKVTTTDGKEINFSANLEMSNETMQELTIQIKAGQALTDPLALNYDGKGVALTDEKYTFDLNSDGEAENISFVKQGSGFLVLDKNQNGQVDDGSEMFGPATNNGFLELKAYDLDNNDWIDEKDAIFYQLNLWTKDEIGADTLSTLQENDIGAIYLNTAQTQLAMGDNGQLKETGVYLKENGEVNFIQEVDLAT